MRTLILAAALAGLVWSADKVQAATYEGPWCAIVPTGDDSVNERCDMRSFEMCLQEIRGIGGSCNLNPRYRGPAENERQKPRRNRDR